MTLREKAKQGIITLYQKQSSLLMVSYQCTHAASCHPDWRAKEKVWKVVRRQKTTAAFQRFHCFSACRGLGCEGAEQSKCLHRLFYPHNPSTEYVVSISHSTGSMKSGSSTSAEQQMHLTKSHENFSPISYGIAILRILFGKNAIHTKPTWIVISDVHEVVEAL